jgi:hypothetical protein
MIQREKTRCFIFVTIAGEKKVVCGPMIITTPMLSPTSPLESVRIQHNSHIPSRFITKIY